MKKFICFTSMTSIILVTPAYAYLDPGTGSILLQGLAACLVGVAVFWRTLLTKIKELFGKKTSEKASEADDSDE
jgi:hypothetical protein